MANIRIDNLTDDTLTVCLDSTEYTLPEDDKLTVNNVEKGRHIIVVRSSRKYVDSVSTPDDKADSLSAKLSKDESSQYVRLSGEFTVDISSSKVVLVVKKDLLLTSKTGVDALFSGFEAEISGGKIVRKEKKYANKKTRRSFLIKQFMGAFLPIGVGIIIFTFLGLLALSANAVGHPITLGGTKFTYPWTFGLLAIDLGFIGYFITMIVNILLTDKKYK